MPPVRPATRRPVDRTGPLSGDDILCSAWRLSCGIAHGSFYTYFGSKAEVFRTLVNEVMETGLCAPRVPVTPRTGGRTPNVAEACSSQGRTPMTSSPTLYPRCWHHRRRVPGSGRAPDTGALRRQCTPFSTTAWGSGRSRSGSDTRPAVEELGDHVERSGLRSLTIANRPRLVAAHGGGPRSPALANLRL
jgi:hypothetical protein